MSSGKTRLEDKLYRATDNDLIFFTDYPLKMDEQVVSKADLLSLHPAPLPPQPTPDPAPPPPPAPDPAEVLVVHSAVGLSVRVGPNVMAKKIAVLADGDTVDVVGSAVGGDYHWAQLVRVNGLKFAETGFVAREFLSPKAQVPA